MIRYAIRHPTTIVVLTLLTFIFGLVSYRALPRENFPDVKIPVVLVTTPYIGVSPSDVEALITTKIESELASLTDMKRLASSSAEGISIVSIEFEPEVDIQDALQKVRDRVARAKPKLPEDAEDPTVQEISFSNFPIMLVTLSGAVDESVLKRTAEDLDDELTRVPGVLDVDVSGGRNRQIRVQVNPERLASYGLSMDDVLGAIATENINIPGGTITEGRGTFLVRTPSEILDPRALERIALKRVGDRPVFVTDVAQVVDDFEDRLTYSRKNGLSSVTLAVKKRSGANILEVAGGVKAMVAERAATFPAGVSYEILADASEDIELMVADLENNIASALVLVIGCVVLLMGLRAATFVAMSIPMSMFGTYIVLDALDYSLNTIVLFTLVLALGILVDNAIVVVENIYRHLELGKDRMQAALDGTHEVLWPVVGATATAVLGFFPLIFWKGVMGQFMGYLPKTIIITLVWSLLAAMVMLPPLSVWFLPKEIKRDGPMPEPIDVGGTAFLPEELDPIDPNTLSPFMRAYYKLLSFSIDHRYLSAVMIGVVFVGSFWAFANYNHGVEFFPSIPPERAIIGVRLPEGADLEATDKVVLAIEQVLPQFENVTTFVSEVGVSSSGDPLVGFQSRTNEGRVTVTFRKSIDKQKEGDPPRVENTFATIEKLREVLDRFPGAQVTVEPEEYGPPVGKAISIEVTGKTYHEVGAAAEALQRAVEDVTGVADLTNDYLVGRPELQLRIDRGAAKRIGASSQSIASSVRTAIAGAKASALRDGEDEHDIIVELEPAAKEDLQRMLSLRVPGREDTSPSTFPVPLSAVASWELAGGAGTINHVDQRLVVTIQGDVSPQFNEQEVRDNVKALVAEWDQPEGIQVRFGGADDEQRDAQEFLGWAFALGCALVLTVMIAQFDAFLVPVIILATVALSLIGVFWGLILTGTPFGIIMTGLGVISNAGTVVNNGIVLLDFVTQLRTRGLDTRQALLKSGVTRFRPVMLTAWTTVLGILPMSMGLSIDFIKGQMIWGTTTVMWWGPMAVAVVWGTSFATILTLVLVPTFYSILDDIQDVPRRLRGLVGLAAGALLLLLVGSQARAATLDEAWTAAEDQNVELRLAREQLAQARTWRWQALTAVMPRVTAGATFAVNQDEYKFDFTEGIPEEFLALLGDGASEPVVVQPKSAWTANLNIHQPLLNGQAFPAWRAAIDLGEAAEHDYERARDQVRGGVARAYYGLAVARESVPLAEEALATARHVLDLANRQVTAGLADRRAVLQAELSIARAERDLDTTGERVRQAEEAFTRLTGLPRDTPVAMPEPPGVPADADSAVQQALASRPDIAGAAERVDAARKERLARDLEWLPSVGLNFTEIYNQVPGFVPKNWQWRLGIDLNWTLWDGGLRIFRSQELASRTRSASLLVEQRQLDAEQEIRTLWEQLERARTAYEAVESEVALAEESLRLAEASFSAGRATWLDVEQARLSVSAARMGRLTERMDRDLAAIDLMVAMGAL